MIRAHQSIYYWADDYKGNSVYKAKAGMVNMSKYQTWISGTDATMKQTSR